MEKDTGKQVIHDCNGGTVTDYDDVIDVAIAWNGDFEGVGVGLTYGVCSR